jgi:hypothetical protein
MSGEDLSKWKEITSLNILAFYHRYNYLVYKNKKDPTNIKRVKRG